MFSVQAPNIVLSFSSDQVLYAGENVSLSCTINFTASVDTDIEVNTTWLRQNVTLSNSTERVSILPTVSWSLSVFTSVLNISPLSDTDNATFTCKARASSRNALIINSDESEMEMQLPVFVRRKLMLF